MQRNRISLFVHPFFLTSVLFSAAAFAELLDTTLPADFPAIKNDYLGVPVIGFGSRGRVDRIPVIFLPGNNDTPFPTACNRFGYIHNAAQYFLDHGYKPSELWGLGYQGDQCDLPTEITRKSGVAHSTAAAVPLIRAFVHAVLEYTGAPSIDLVGQGQYDLVLGTSHLGIVNSPQTWQSALEFLSKRPDAQ
jgi:hypothetical protein